MKNQDHEIKPHVDLAITSLHAALARAGATPDDAADLLLDAMDQLEKAIDILHNEIEADIKTMEEVQAAKKKRRAA